ncbi:CubicO group peptidase (beta-lactamase class C family) [Luteimonas cucumeris]|uniref:CubicO group peptidase (Beta-lactamase class C family) n=1 Tax=Luteimonas cucumeris TaxID=985012 RepID=A0A562L7D8_9GAMM|nr:serine hydrolase [Luteimonas cucumeris]TWI03560.1 CubicO group peptidase (beta-lactamase class C family) [Luteimonas cucumeris]
MKKPWFQAILALLAIASLSAHAVKPVDADIDAAFDDAVARYDLPGLAVGVVRDGEIVYLRTAGELAVGSGNEITPETLFKIASNSKAMTAALLARLVDAGKLKWDDPVIKHLPGFRMYDPWVTREIQVRDLLIHNSGMGAGAGDLMLWPSPNAFTRDDVIAGLAHLKPVYSFRSRYAYDNTLYIVAGEVAAAVGGAPYEELVRREIFEPLALTRCQVGEWRRDEVGNVAQPHSQRDGRNVVAGGDGDVIEAIPMAAAGGIRCSLNDMLTWAKMWLTPDRFGLVDGKPWLSQAQRDAVWSAQMTMPLSKRMRDWDGSHYSAYGYGWRLADVDGTQKVSHTGTLSGMYSALTLLPEKNIGFVILINADADEARTVLNQTLVKHFTAPAQKRTLAYYAQRIAAEDKDETAARPVPDTSLRIAASSTAMQQWLGVYRDPWFGEVSICPKQDAVHFTSAKSPMLAGKVMQLDDRFLVDWDAESVDTEPWLAFVAAGKNQPAAMTMAKIDPDADFSYDYEDLHFSRVRGCP